MICSILPRRDAFKDILYRVVTDVGYNFTPRAYLEKIELWSHLRALFSRHNVTCVVDVGANEGQFRNFLRRRCGYMGLILSFEPVRSVYELIEDRSLRDPQWFVFNLALGSLSGQRQINVMQDPHFSSFLDPHMSDIEKPDIASKNVVVRRETVEVRCLSEVLEQLRSKHDLSRIYLKMDTQGHDFEVLKGVGAWLENVVALQTEVSIKALYKGMMTFAEAMRELASYGFEVTSLCPVVRDTLFRVIEFDCVAINSRPMASSPVKH